jgi:hypothetical protein
MYLMMSHHRPQATENKQHQQDQTELMEAAKGN